MAQDQLQTMLGTDYFSYQIPESCAFDVHYSMWVRYLWNNIDGLRYLKKINVVDEVNYLAIHILLLYISRTHISWSALTWERNAAIWLAIKMEMVNEVSCSAPVFLSELLIIEGSRSNQRMLLRAEQQLCLGCSFSFAPVLAHHFCDVGITILGLNSRQSEIKTFLRRISCTSVYITNSPATIASVAMISKCPEHKQEILTLFKVETCLVNFLVSIFEN